MKSESFPVEGKVGFISFFLFLAFCLNPLKEGCPLAWPREGLYVSEWNKKQTKAAKGGEETATLFAPAGFFRMTDADH